MKPLWAIPYILASALLALPISCVEVLGVGDELEPLVTVNCLLDGNAEVQTLELTYSGSMSVKRPEYEPVTDAEAVLYEEGREAGRFEKTEEPGKWVLAFKPTEGKKYRLEVLVPGEGLISARTEMPYSTPVMFQAAGDNPGLYGYLEDFPPILGQAVYHFQPYLRGFVQSMTAGPYWVYMLHDYYGMGGESYYKVEYKDLLPRENHRLLAPEIGTDHPNVDDFNMSGRMIRFPRFPMDNELDLYNVRVGTGALNPGPYDLYDINCSGGTKEHRYYLRIGETDIAPSDSISFFIAGRVNYSSIIFRAVSPEYDRYLRECLNEAFTHFDGASFESWFEEKTLYSNISGGLGVFGAYIDKVL